MSPLLTPELIDFLESGVSLLVAGRDAALRPHCLRGVGARAESDRTSATVFVVTDLAEALLDGFADNGQIAVALSRPIDHRTLQLKGRVQEMRPATRQEETLQERYLAGFVEQLYCVGFSRTVVRRMRLTPSTAIRFAIEQVFDQTPGPGAGRTLKTDRAP